MFRDRTNLFLLYRKTVTRDLSINASMFDTLDAEERFILNRRVKRLAYQDSLNPNDGNSYQLEPFVPSFYDIAKQLDSRIESIKQSVSQLNSSYKRLIIIAKLEKRALEEKIQDTSYLVLKHFEQCYVLVKKFEHLETNQQKLGFDYSNNDMKILDNFKRIYAARIQEQSLIFRSLQSNYIKFLRDDEDETDTVLSSTQRDAKYMDQEPKSIDQDAEALHKIQTQSQQQELQDLLLMVQREHEISKLAMGILEILTIFKEMEALVVEQGTLLDRIDYNLQNTAQDLKLSDMELVKAKRHQKKSTKCKLILFLSLFVLLLFIIVVMKPHTTKTIAHGQMLSTVSSTSPTPTILTV